VFDGRCIKLAKLCRISIDYAKNGKAVEIDDMTLKLFNKPRPDWSRPEIPGTRQVDYYESRRALGYLFRNINLHSPNELLDRIPITHPGEIAPLEDTISRTLAPLVQSALNGTLGSLEAENVRTADLHIWYASEMRFICVTHSIAISPDVHLSEEEVVLGIILGKYSQQLFRTDRGERMRMQAEMLVRDLRAQIVPIDAPLVEEDLRRGLRDAWGVWCWAQHQREKPFIQSFSLVTLGLVLDLLIAPRLSL
jgi:RNA-dependent RNA polymerase